MKSYREQINEIRQCLNNLALEEVRTVRNPETLKFWCDKVISKTVNFNKRIKIWK